MYIYIYIISKIHREPCLDGKKKHIAPLKLVPDLPLQGLPPKSFASCALVPSALQGLPKKLCYIQTSIVNFNGEGLRCFLVRNAQETPECLRAILPVRRNLLEFLPNCCALLVVAQLLRELLMGELVCKVQRRSAFQFLPVVDAKRLPLHLFTQPLQDLHVGAKWHRAPPFVGGNE